ncbi:MAG: hypothetical protein MUP44_03575, partial [Anaerolineales bacterium]|nr:hypothetical protein [Anaerolineales bacterium]
LAHLKDPATVIARIIDEEYEKLMLTVNESVDRCNDEGDKYMSITGYTKLFGTIVGSTIWREPKETKILWITMLAMSDKDGHVDAAIPGLANFAGLTIPETEASLQTLLSPDHYSRTKTAEGRRVEEIPGGWKLINHAKYRDMMNADSRREYLKIKQQEHRARDKARQHPSTTVVVPYTPSTHSDADTDTKADTDTNTEKGANAPLGGKAKPRNELMDALAECCGILIGEIGGVAPRLMKVLKAIKASTPEVTPQEIVRRAANYRSQFRDAILTPEALGKHWSMCHAQKPGTNPINPEAEDRLNAF